MLYRTLDGNIIEINIMDYKNDKQYYEEIMKIYKK
jgi:hypothetical protein